MEDGGIAIAEAHGPLFIQSGGDMVIDFGRNGSGGALVDGSGEGSGSDGMFRHC